MTYPVKSALVILLLAAMGLPQSAPQAVDAAGRRAGGAAGTYSAVMPLGGGLTFPVLFTLHSDGTATSQDVTDFGATSVAAADGPHLNTVAVGSWERDGRRSFQATLIYFRSAVDGGGEVNGVGRLTITGTFNRGFQTGTADVIVESFPCAPATIGCSDPALLPPPTAPVFGTFALSRITP